MSRPIDEIDRNLKVQTTLSEPDIRFHDVRREPFRIYGLYDARNEPTFRRMPAEVARAANEGVAALAQNTAGGRVRFRTNSRYVAIKAVLPSVTNFPHMTLAGTSGFDLYLDQAGQSVYYKTFMPPVGMKDGYESMIYFPDHAERSLTINFPLYNSVDILYVGLQGSASLAAGTPYAHARPVLYYGSSITQGGCASRPGNSYQAIISRRWNCDHINLGFSGSARGEASMAEYIAGQDISAFVCDYDYNAPSVDHLQATHAAFIRTIRSKQPDLPIILVSKPDFDLSSPESIARRDVIYSTYRQAVQAGDKHIDYIDGQSLFKDEYRDCCTVDGCHPNDAGFVRMAEVIGQLVGRVLREGD